MITQRAKEILDLFRDDEEVHCDCEKRRPGDVCDHDHLPGEDWSQALARLNID